MDGVVVRKLVAIGLEEDVGNLLVRRGGELHNIARSVTCLKSQYSLQKIWD